MALFAIAAEVDKTTGEIRVKPDQEKQAALILMSEIPNLREEYGWTHESLTVTNNKIESQIRIELQDIMAKTLESFDFIAEAEVEFTPPSREWPTNQQWPAKATVRIRVQNDEMLEDTQVKGIAELVGGAYHASLTPENVLIIDQAGRPYHYDPNWKLSVDSLKNGKAR